MPHSRDFPTLVLVIGFWKPEERGVNVQKSSPAATDLVIFAQPGSTLAVRGSRPRVTAGKVSHREACCGDPLAYGNMTLHLETANILMFLPKTVQIWRAMNVFWWGGCFPPTGLQSVARNDSYRTPRRNTSESRKDLDYPSTVAS